MKTRRSRAKGDAARLSPHFPLKLKVPNCPNGTPLFLLSGEDIGLLVGMAGPTTNPAAFLWEVLASNGSKPRIDRRTIAKSWETTPTRPTTLKKLNTAHLAFSRIVGLSVGGHLPVELDKVVQGCSRDWAEWADDDHPLFPKSAMPRMRREVATLAEMEGKLLSRIATFRPEPAGFIRQVTTGELCERLLLRPPRSPGSDHQVTSHEITEEEFQLFLWRGRISALLRILAAAELDWSASLPTLPISFSKYLPEWDAGSKTLKLPVGRYLEDLKRRAKVSGWKEMAKRMGLGDRDHQYRKLKRWRCGEIIPSQANIRTLLRHLASRKSAACLATHTETDFAGEIVCFTVAAVLQGLLGAACAGLKPSAQRQLVTSFQSFRRHREELATTG